MGSKPSDTSGEEGKALGAPSERPDFGHRASGLAVAEARRAGARAARRKVRLQRYSQNLFDAGDYAFRFMHGRPYVRVLHRPTASFYPNSHSFPRFHTTQKFTSSTNQKTQGSILASVLRPVCSLPPSMSGCHLPSWTTPPFQLLMMPIPKKEWHPSTSHRNQ